MEFPVLWRGEKIGEVTITEMPHAVAFSVNCACMSEELLRCYAETEQGPLLIGVVEPLDHRLVCHRKLSKQSLHGYSAGIPRQYYLSSDGHIERACAKKSDLPLPPSNHQPRLWTGETLLDRMIAGGMVTVQETPAGLQLSCPFEAGMQFPLACVATACRITQTANAYTAVLILQSPFYRT